MKKTKNKLFSKMDKKNVLALLSGILFFSFGFSQYHYPLEPIPVENVLSPFTGGFNSCHIATIDLNFDGVDDLLIFDKVGERVSAFIVQKDGTYLHQADFALDLAILSWIQCVDYNNDGKKDLFTYNGMGGIQVYKNTSTNNQLQFELATQAIPVNMFHQKIPLYCTSVDYPAFVDIDGDGNVDILNFWVATAGDFLHYYQNISSHPDTLLFEITDWSWGCFVESSESNEIFLDSCKTATSSSHTFAASKHTGSSLFTLKNQNTGLYDLVLGDIGFSDLLYLNNTGSVESAYISSYKTIPVNLDYCPVISQIQDPITKEKKLIISPFSAETLESMGGASIHKYKLQDSKWLLEQTNFLQDQTIDLGIGANPQFVYNKTTNLWDFVVGNYVASKGQKYASIHYYKNIGTKLKPAFKLIDTDYGQLSSFNIQGASPCFGDIDNDGEMEMIVGTKNGRLFLVKDGKVTDTFFGKIQVGEFAAPQLIDLNQNGLLDLVVGEKRKVWKSTPKNITKGNLNYFQNTGSPENPEFTLISDSLGGVDVIDRNFSNYGYARPFFYLNRENEFELICGSENGELFRYSNISNNLDGIFTKESPIRVNNRTLKVGIHSAPTMADINGDGYLDLIVGNLAGGIQIFNGGEDNISTQPTLDFQKLALSPNPSRTFLNIPREYLGLQYTWTNLNGTKMDEGILRTDFLDSSHLPRGIYILKIGNTAHKIILH